MEVKLTYSQEEKLKWLLNFRKQMNRNICFYSQRSINLIEREIKELEDLKNGICN